MVMLRGLKLDEALKTIWDLTKKGEYGEIFRRGKNFIRLQFPAKLLKQQDLDSIVILSPPHTLFQAENVLRALERHGKTAVVDSNPNQHSFPARLYIVIAPQYFSRLPPGQKRVVYQVEQVQHSAVFDASYKQILQESFCVLEYSKTNLAHLASHGLKYPHVFYVPFAGNSSTFQEIEGLTETRTKGPILYGDFWSSPRRRSLLETAQVDTNWTLINNSFGVELQESLAQCKFVVNYHYFRDANLEVPRIFEALSYGAKVISEESPDMQDYEFNGVVEFITQTESPTSFIKQVENAMGVHSHVDSEKTLSVLIDSERKFFSYFDRFLFASGLISSEAYLSSNLPKLNPSGLNCLTLSETVERNTKAKSNAPAGTNFIEGIRHSPGWIGCGYSYKAIAMAAQSEGFDRITVYEDDVILPENFEEQYARINRFLDSIQGDWDVYVGLIADLHEDSKVQAVASFENHEFVTLNKMTSMVFNIYSKNCLDAMANWTANQADVIGGTIDRYLESVANLRVITSLDIIFGHRGDADSTLWNAGNFVYENLIRDSRKDLSALVKGFKESEKK